jgi:hypothetical protein
MFRYKVHTALGEAIGEATYRFLLEPGEELRFGSNQRFRVVKVVPIEEQGSEVVALLYVETA